MYNSSVLAGLKVEKYSWEVRNSMMKISAKLMSPWMRLLLLELMMLLVQQTQLKKTRKKLTIVSRRTILRFFVRFIYRLRVG